MSLSPILVAKLAPALPFPVLTKPVYRVPSLSAFARLALAEQAEAINRVQRELDLLEIGVRTDRITTSRRTRGASLRNIRARQQRLNTLAASFGFRHEWRKHVRVRAVTEQVQR